jgi:hypothetical protein
MAATSMIMERRFINFRIKDSSNYIIQIFTNIKNKTANLPVPISGQVFCYNENHKRGSARFSRLVGYFKLFVDCYCKRTFEVLYF